MPADLPQLALGCLIWLPLAVCIISLLHWAIQGDLDFITAIIGIGIAFGVGYTAMKPPIPILAPISVVAVFVTVICFPAMQLVMQRHQHHGIDVENVERAYRNLGQRPDNPLAKFKLAESIYRIGLVGHAVALGDVAVTGLPERVATEEYRMLKRWKRVGVPPDTLKPIVCVECQTPCQPGWTHCRNCGAMFLLDRARGRVLPKGAAKKLLAVWACVMLLGVGVPSATALPIAGCVAAIIALVAIVGAIAYLGFRPQQDRVY